MSFVNHKFLKKDDLEDRKYQSNISKACLEQSTLVILPTGMGKTVVALRIMLERLDIGKILLMAPTKPLAQQHFDFFNNFLKPMSVYLLAQFHLLSESLFGIVHK